MQEQEIDKSKICFFKKKYLDEVGQICKYEDKFIRIINKSKTNYVKKLLASGLIDELMERGFLTECYQGNLTYDGRIIIYQATVEPVNQECMYHWCFEMHKAAAKLVLQINEICNKYGYQLMDCHQYNIKFHGTKPIYIDFGSIAKWDGGCWRAKENFLKYYYYPLHLWSMGYQDIALAMLSTDLKNNKEQMELIYYSISGEKDTQEINLAGNELLEKIEEWQNADQQYWSNYQDNYWNKIIDKRFSAELEWISVRDIKSMTEIGANQGYFSYLVATHTNVSQIIATDFDRGALDKMYRRFCENKLVAQKVTPLFLDVSLASAERLRNMASDLLVANALMHHLIFTHKMRIESIINNFFIMTKKYLIVEFVPRGMAFGSRIPKWYTLEWFILHLSEKFDIERIEESVFGRVQIYAKCKELENANG